MLLQLNALPQRFYTNIPIPMRLIILLLEKNYNLIMDYYRAYQKTWWQKIQNRTFQCIAIVLLLPMYPPLSVSVAVSGIILLHWFFYSCCLVAHFFLVFPILSSLDIFLLPPNFALVPQLQDLVNVASVKTFLNNYLHLESGIYLALFVL